MEQREFEITVKMPVTANSSVRVPQRIKIFAENANAAIREANARYGAENVTQVASPVIK